MLFIKYLSNITSIDEKYLTLIVKSFLNLIILNIIRFIGIKALKNIKNKKREYIFTQKFKVSINILKVLAIIFIWSEYISKFMTIISFVSAAFTIALREIIFNFFSGIYIKIKKPFKIEDRIEINNYKGDVININALNFEVLEVNNETFMGQSTGVITHIPNSIIFNYPLRNYNKAFKYIWNELTIKVSIKCDIQKTKSILYKIVNSNKVINQIPNKMKNQINNISNEYRIYFNKYEPTIYTKVIDNHIELTIRYLIHPKKARYINSDIWNSILEAYKNNEIDLYIG